MNERKGWIVIDPWNDDTGNLGVADFEGLDHRLSKPNRERRRPKAQKAPKSNRNGSGLLKRERVESRDGTFRCKHCKTVVGKPISGGRHRNHCPLCLHSRHVDLKTPGDRSASCRSLMRAIGLFTRRDGEQVLVHECLGCGVVRNNRVAADDNIVATMRLPVVQLADNKRPEPRSRSA